MDWELRETNHKATRLKGLMVWIHSHDLRLKVDQRMKVGEGRDDGPKGCLRWTSISWILEVGMNPLILTLRPVNGGSSDRKVSPEI